MTIYEVKKRLEGYGYVFSRMYFSPTMPGYRILKSPRNDYNKVFIGYPDMCRMIEDEEEIIRKRRSERIENILGHANK